MRLLGFSVCLCILCTTTSFSQDEEDIARSEEYYQLGMEIFDYAHRKQAVDLFLQAVAFNPASAKAHLMAGRAIMLTINREFAVPHLIMAYELDPAVDPDIFYYLGQGYHHAEDFENAIKFYNRYYLQVVRSQDPDKDKKLKSVNKHIFECQNAMIYMANPVDVTITHLDERINSEWPDYAPTVNEDGTFMVFTSRRPDDNVNPSLAEDYEYYEEVFYSEKINGEWQRAKNIGPPINTRYHNASVNLSPDGKELFLYKDSNGGDIYYSLKDEKGDWSDPRPVEGINSPYLESSASITRDGKTIYFTSDRPGGYGGTDIYMAKLGKNNRWTSITNLGPLVNSEFDEEAVFISANGEHLYFSSNGHAGMGDMDIYRSTLNKETGEWSVPENMGYPINSVETDIFLSMTGDEHYAYISSVREGSIGEQDIFVVDMRNWKPIKYELLLESEIFTAATGPVSISMNYVVVDAESNENVKADFTIHSADKSQIKIEPNSKGSYQHAISMRAAESAYKIVVQADAYETHNQSLHLLGRGQIAYAIIDTIRLERKTVVQPAQSELITQAPSKEQPLSQLQPQAVQVMSNACIIDIYFAHDSDEPLSVSGVQGLLKSMLTNPNQRIEVRGYTDNNGHPDYNRELSLRRANSVKNYLVKSGIEESRIQTAGFGQENPIADNSTYEGRRLNRRVEFAIILE